MKIRESGMPDEAMWETFFDPAAILNRLGLNDPTADIVEFGCGYGTFTLAAAVRTKGEVHAFDIEPKMLEATQAKLEEAKHANVRLGQRDFIADGSGLSDDSIDYVFLFNILHGVDPTALLREAHRILRSNGKVAVIHWRPDPTTPRGPDMAIRPSPEQCRQWILDAGFASVTQEIDLPPYHFGITGLKA